MPSCRVVVANNCARYGQIVSRVGGVCLVVGVRWLTIVLDMVRLLAAVVEYALLSGAAANNCARYGQIVSRGGGVCADVGVRRLTIVLDMVTLLAAVVEYALLSGFGG